MSETERAPGPELLRSALRQLDEIKEAIARTSKVGRIKLDATLLRQERSRLFERLGEQTFRLIEEGVIEPPEALTGTVTRIRQAIERIREEEQEIDALLGQDAAGAQEQEQEQD